MMHDYNKNAVSGAHDRSHDKGRVLLVDDEEGIRLSFGELLRVYGYEVLLADCPQAAMDVLDQHSEIDVVICDLKMPGGSGLDVLRHIHQKSLGVPLIFLTGFGTLDSCQEALKHGAFDYILKPVVKEDRLMYPLNHAIDKRRLERRNAELQRDIIAMVEEHQQILNEFMVDSDVMAKIQGRISRIVDKWSARK